MGATLRLPPSYAGRIRGGIHALGIFQGEAVTEELQHYSDIAATEIDTTAGSLLAEHLLRLSAAIGRTGSVLVEAEGRLLRAERHWRDEALKGTPDVSEARITAYVKAQTID